MSVHTENETSPVAMSPAVVPPPEFDSIDVADVLREFQAPGETTFPGHYGIDHPVVRIAEPACISVETAPCPVCNGRSANPLFALANSRFRLVQCDECQLGAIHPRPNAAEIRAFYPASYYGAAGAKFVPLIERAVRWIAARRAKWLLRGLPRGGNVLDIGCGRGVLLHEMARAGFRPHGFELSRQAAQGLAPSVDLQVGGRLSAADYADGKFDLVILWHVLEHLPDPRATIQEIGRILKPGGRLAIAVPNFSSLQAKLFGPAWFHLDLPRHLFHFPTSALKRLLSNCGFGMEHERHFSLRQNPFGWVQSALNAAAPNSRNALYTQLKQTSDTGRPSGIRRWAMQAAYWLGMPVALAASMFAAGLGRGGTVCVTARSTKRLP